jgi:hypothetical protein
VSVYRKLRVADVGQRIELVIPFLLPALLLQIPLFWFFWNDVTGTHKHHASQALAKGGL